MQIPRASALAVGIMTEDHKDGLVLRNNQRAREQLTKTSGMSILQKKSYVTICNPHPGAKSVEDYPIGFSINDNIGDTPAKIHEDLSPNGLKEDIGLHQDPEAVHATDILEHCDGSTTSNMVVPRRLAAVPGSKDIKIATDHNQHLGEFHLVTFDKTNLPATLLKAQLHTTLPVLRSALYRDTAIVFTNSPEKSPRSKNQDHHPREQDDHTDSQLGPQISPRRLNLINRLTAITTGFEKASAFTAIFPTAIYVEQYYPHIRTIYTRITNSIYQSAAHFTSNNSNSFNTIVSYNYQNYPQLPDYNAPIMEPNFDFDPTSFSSDFFNPLSDFAMSQPTDLDWFNATFTDTDSFLDFENPITAAETRAGSCHPSDLETSLSPPTSSTSSTNSATKTSTTTTTKHTSNMNSTMRTRTRTQTSMLFRNEKTGQMLSSLAGLAQPSAFRFSRDYWQHKAQSHNDFRYRCQKGCGKGFARHDNLVQHHKESKRHRRSPSPANDIDEPPRYKKARKSSSLSSAPLSPEFEDSHSGYSSARGSYAGGSDVTVSTPVDGELLAHPEYLRLQKEFELLTARYELVKREVHTLREEKEVWQAREQLRRQNGR
ncbi:hypothetical protein ABW21_db0202872 [Orbilia brochopaga]|nr:hypothetical protein ABW21_db0202872 [Drechslerella brochopaga]